MLQLVAKSGPLQGWAWPIVAEPLVLGRDRSCVIQLDEPVVSRWHCRVYLEDGVAYVRDLESRNATLVNGESVTTVKLSVGDEVSVGTSIFVVSHLQGHSTPTKSNLRSAKDTSSLNVNAPI
jgi:pSer/pThr/pTyr-binding forkhead associated (FHA) protein